ncbi:MAG TPA: hypothetical protein PLZ51_12360, partial [Aggregatilineales bacterium]|nr:hypothetical protein [Aggregatilineales bacterium]
SITMKGHTGYVNQIIQLASGNILSMSADATMRLWDTNGVMMRIFMGHTGMIYGAKQLPDGRILSWSEDGTLRFWDENGHTLRIIEAYPERTYLRVEILPDERLLVWDRYLAQIWDMSGELAQPITNEGDIVDGVHILSTGCIILWGRRGNDRIMRLLEPDGTFMTILDAHGLNFGGILELKNGRFFSGSGYRFFNLWEADGTYVTQFRDNKVNRTDGLYILPDGKILS